MHGWQAWVCACVAGVCLSAFGDLPGYDHIVAVIEENHSLNQVIGSANAPYIN